MISEPWTGVMFPKEIVHTESMTSNYGWIFDFVMTERACKPTLGMKVSQFELEITEKVCERKFDKIIFQVGAKTNDDIEGVQQTVFYSLTTMLSYDLDDYSLEEMIHLHGIREYIEKVLEMSYKDKNAYNFEYYSKPIIHKEVPPKFVNLTI